MINIVITTPSLGRDYGGPAYSVPATCDAVASDDVHINLLSVNAESLYGPPTKLLNSQVLVTLVPGIASQSLRFIWSPAFKHSLKQLVMQNRTILHDQGIWTYQNHTVVSIARKRNIPLVISPRGMLSNWALSNKSWKKRIAWHMYQKRDLLSATVLHATSETEACDIRQQGFSQPIAIIPNGMSLPVLKPKTVNTGLKRALFVGRIHPVKGLPNLISAWATVRPKGWKAIIAGPDENGHLQELKQQIKSEGLESEFEISAAVSGDAKTDLYRNSDLFILPSHSENFGMVVAEALACGVPVITTKATPWQELLTHRCGWWVDVGVAPLVEALIEATQVSVNELAEMGARGRQLIESKYTWPQIAKQMHEMYSWILSGGAPPQFVKVNG